MDHDWLEEETVQCFDRRMKSWGMAFELYLDTQRHILLDKFRGG